jgi:hypothetical protein
LLDDIQTKRSFQYWTFISSLTVNFFSKKNVWIISFGI